MHAQTDKCNFSIMMDHGYLYTIDFGQWYTALIILTSPTPQQSTNVCISCDPHIMIGMATSWCCKYCICAVSQINQVCVPVPWQSLLLLDELWSAPPFPCDESVLSSDLEQSNPPASSASPLQIRKFGQMQHLPFLMGTHFSEFQNFSLISSCTNN